MSLPMTEGVTIAGKIMLLTDRRKTVDDLKVRRAIADASVERESSELERVGTELALVDEARTIFQEAAQSVQQKAHRKISGVVTRCLVAVFDDPYEFEIVFEKKRGKTEALLTFVRDGMRLDDPLNEIGGGVIDVAALALRLSCVLLARPVVRRLVVLDEPFKNVRGEGNKRRTREMLVGLAEDLGVQFVISTDIEAYRLGKVLEF